jgi:hypothetical protein
MPMTIAAANGSAGMAIKSFVIYASMFAAQTFER